jgi:hypothetical protein
VVVADVLANVSVDAGWLSHGGSLDSSHGSSSSEAFTDSLKDNSVALFQMILLVTEISEFLLTEAGLVAFPLNTRVTKLQLVDYQFSLNCRKLRSGTGR